MMEGVEEVTFNLNEVEEEKEMQVMPPGKYRGVVANSELKRTKAGTGMYLAVEFVISQPEQFKGRKVFDIINVQNPNETAQEIGTARLKAICVHGGLDASNVGADSIKGVEVGLKLGVEVDAKYGEKNRVKAVISKDDIGEQNGLF